MSQTVPQPKLFACSQSKILAENIAKSYGQDLGNVITSTYSDGEFHHLKNLFGDRVFLLLVVRCLPVIT